MRLPNGFGSVHKLPGKRRNPWRARKTAGWEIVDGVKKQKYITVGYYPTRSDAMQALADFNNNPYDTKTAKTTFGEIYEQWSSEHYNNITASTVKGWELAYKYCSPLYNKKMCGLRTQELEHVIDNADTSTSVKNKMRSLFVKLFTYAMRYDIVVKNYGELCHITKGDGGAKVNRKIFTPEDIKKLWDSQEVSYIYEICLVGIYSGMRAGELCSIKIEDVHLDENYLVGGAKTEAGKNRVVPIHPAIKSIIEKHYKKSISANYKTLFVNSVGQAATRDAYRKAFAKKTLALLGVSHSSHDVRHTFASMAKEARMDDNIIKIIMGHRIDDLTERVYTHRSRESICNEILKIPDYTK